MARERHRFGRMQKSLSIRKTEPATLVLEQLPGPGPVKVNLQVRHLLVLERIMRAGIDIDFQSEGA
jgi:hypothetical protein